MNICTRHIAVIEAWHFIREERNKINIEGSKVDAFTIPSFLFVSFWQLLCPNYDIMNHRAYGCIMQYPIQHQWMQYHDFICHQLIAIQDKVDTTYCIWRRFHWFTSKLLLLTQPDIIPLNWNENSLAHRHNIVYAANKAEYFSNGMRA